jgi:HK97 family phage major capsid protein
MELNKEATPGTPVDTRSAEEIQAAREKAIVDWAGIFGEEGREIARNLLATNKDASQEDVRMAIKEGRDAKVGKVETPVEPATAIAKRAGVELATSTYRGGLLKSFKGPDAHKSAYRCGQFLRAVLTRDESAIVYCRDNGIRLERMHSGTANETGGFLVPDEFENVMIDLRIQYGVFRPNANVVPMAGDTKSRPRRTGGLTAYPIGAGVAITESTKGWDLVTLTAKKWGALAKYENEFSEDSVINVADDLASEMAYAFVEKEDQCGFNGTGDGTYHGIVGVIPKLLGVDGTIGNIKGLKVAAGNAYSEITLNDLLGVVAILPQFARRSGQVKWYCSHTVWANVLQRVALAVGGVTHAEVEGGLQNVFLGYPVEIVEVMPVTEANSQICALFGNLSQAAMFGDRRGVTIAMTDSDATDFAEDQMAIRGTERFDINVHDVGNTSVAGPVVGLITAAA